MTSTFSILEKKKKSRYFHKETNKNLHLSHEGLLAIFREHRYHRVQYYIGLRQIGRRALDKNILGA